MLIKKGEKTDYNIRRLRSRKRFSFVMVLLMVSGIFIIGCIPKNVAAVDLIIFGTYTISGTETYGNITVTGTGKLVVSPGATLNVLNITLEPGSIFEVLAGRVLMTNPNPSGDVIFNGTCLNFAVGLNSNISLIGADGYADTSSPGPYDAYIPTSRGGNAVFNITVTGSTVLGYSSLYIAGGQGFDLPASTNSNVNSWTDGLPLGGYEAAGGNASFKFRNTNSSTGIPIQNTFITVKW